MIRQLAVTRRWNYRGVQDRFTRSQILSPGTNSLGTSEPLITKSSKSYQTYEGTERQPYPLTKDESFAFLEDCLCIENPLECYRKDPESLLNIIVERMKKKVPFTTGQLFVRPLNETSDIIGKYQIFSGHGGICGTINPFINALLQNIGYKTMQINGGIVQLGYATHLSTVACDVTYPGSRHLVETGSTRLLLGAIPLDFEKESPVYKYHYTYNKFFKRDGNLIWCVKVPTQKLLSSLKEFEMMTDTEGVKWQILISYRPAQKNARVVFNKFWQEFVRGEKGVSIGVDTFVYTGFLGDKFVTMFGTHEGLTVTSFDEDGTVEKLHMGTAEVKIYFQKNYKTFSQRLLDKIITANYQYIPNNKKYQL